MASICILMARKEFAGQSPTEIPEGTPLDEWLETNFFIVGPLSDAEAEIVTESVRETDPDRFWATLPLKYGQAVEDLI